jgi:hypothetical protein
VARSQVDDAQKQLQEFQRRLSTTTGARHSVLQRDTRFREFIRQHQLDVDMSAIAFERSCAFKETDFYRRALPYISRFHQARVQFDMARVACLLPENYESPQV